MTLSEIYRKYLQELRELYSQNETAQITSIAFESIAGLHRSDVIKDPSMLISIKILGELEQALMRLKQHEPIQHVTGKAWFCNLLFQVSPAVLVPRPETEELVALASAFIKEKNLSVIDIGTGSGCIAITMKLKSENILVTALDISKDALEIADENARHHKTKIDFKHIDFLEESLWPPVSKYDVIISNPPYIPENDKGLLDKNVSQFEPHAALFEPAGKPFLFYVKIAAFGKTHLLPGGKIFVEIHEDFGNDVLNIFENEGYEAVLTRDMFGKDRFVVAYRKA